MAALQKFLREMSDNFQKIAQGQHLMRAEADAVMEEVLSGHVAEAQLIEFLTAMNAKGPSVEELVGFATAMRRHAAPVFNDKHPRPAGALVDTCGTGGDGAGTFNISTAAAFVVAGAGARVAKHGNRSASSRCGSADVLEALGVNISAPPERAAEAIKKIGIGFLFAPSVHAAMRHAAAARKKLGVRTVFNLLGPLTNPAGATAQVIGVPEKPLTELLACALAALGIERALVVHGADGLDEFSSSAETIVAELRGGEVRSYTVSPEDFGLRRTPREALAGGDAAHNARIIQRVLGRAHSPQRDVVLMNAAAALVVAGHAVDFLDGMQLAARSMDSGAAREKLDALIAFSRQP
jgi:anthranilate phosphoribosyltransferase